MFFWLTTFLHMLFSLGFVNGGKGSSSGKTSKETVKSGQKAALDSLKTGSKTSLQTPATKGVFLNGILEILDILNKFLICSPSSWLYRR